MIKIAKWRKIDELVVFSNRWMKVVEKTFLNASHKQIKYYILNGGVVVCALGITEDEKVIVIQQYRPSIESVTIDIPGGGVNPGEDPVLAIKREFLEETGYKLVNPQKLTEFNFDSGRSNTKTHVFFGTAVKFSKQKLDKDENIKLLIIPVAKVKKLIESNQLTEPSLKIAFLQWYYFCRKNDK